MSVIEDNWDYYININNLETKSYYEFETKVSNLQSNIFYLLDNGFQTPQSTFNGIPTEYQDDELKDLVERKKELRHEIDKKLDEISHQQVQYEKYKKDQKLLSQEIKEKHEAFLMAKKYYKKFLKMYFTVESRAGENQTIFVQFFTEAKKDSENYSIRLQRNTKMGQYLILSTTPKLSILKELQKRLQDTNDVPGALYSVRQAFLDMKNNKK